MFTDTPMPESEVSPETKFNILKSILPIADHNPNLVISGSLSQVLSRKESADECIITPGDLASIRDIDLMVLEFERGRYDQLAKRVSQPGYEVECKIPQTFSYLSDKGRGLSERVAKIDIGDGNIYQVRFTTPEYLLVTRASAEGGGKRDTNGKIRKRIVELQQMPTFSRERFIELASLELRTLKEVKRSTFKLWQTILREDSPNPTETWEEFSQRRSKDFRSIIDQARLGNLVKSPEDVSKVDSEDIRPISNLERFLEEFTRGEEVAP